ncbi:MAG: hypothetical protein CMM77_05195 [Rhodospirillaceae bacterium]|jgi:hypothetical protein|nr:hypothetical protein [Magnetovibrio sp.]MAY66503.1 hypothetical protein [Rhodospirillaceae bacterium]|tara:strand:+ start:724 stop:1044 length:321 start_codon:yes stop_codon:yes gene_type:complete
MNTNVVEFYKKVRTDQNLIEALSEGKTTEEFIKAAVNKAAEMGITLQQDDVVTACRNFEDLCKLAANDDELTEFELEMISAGGLFNGFESGNYYGPSGMTGIGNQV